MTSPRRYHWSLLEDAQSMLVLTSIALFLITFTLQPSRIPSASMEPTLLVGDFLLVDKQIESSPLFPPAGLRRGDVIVFHDPVDPTRDLVKRIIAIPGDRVHLRAGRVILNGEPLIEPYAVHRAAPPDFYRDNFPNGNAPDPDVQARWWIQFHGLREGGDLSIPPDHFFVLGDNRNDSLDSRYWGLVSRAEVIGKPFLIYASLLLPDRDPQSEASTAQQSRLPLRFARWNRTFTLIH